MIDQSIYKISVMPKLPSSDIVQVHPAYIGWHCRKGVHTTKQQLSSTLDYPVSHRQQEHRSFKDVSGHHYAYDTGCVMPAEIRKSCRFCKSNGHSLIECKAPTDWSLKEAIKATGRRMPDSG